jgi:6-pyruvoyltetrahydropterin/6-carboxytetrahydropterin synthase
MEIARRTTFDAAHRLPHHNGKCRKLHGHHYVVEARVVGDVQPADGRSEGGMVVDFSAIDAALDATVRCYDHQTLLYHQDPLYVAIMQPSTLNLAEVAGAADDVQRPFPFGIIPLSFVPTAENLAANFLTALKGAALGVNEVTVWETEKSWATAR